MGKELLDTLSAGFRKDSFALLLSDSLYCKSIVGNIPEDFFDYHPQYSVLFRAYKEFFTLYKNRPRIHELKTYIAQYAEDNSIEDEVLENVLELLDELVGHDEFSPPFVKERFSDAVITHNLNNVLTQAKDYMDNGEFDQLLQEVYKARFSGKEKAEVIEYWKDTDDRVKRRANIHLEVIPTGWEPLDGMMANGGIPRGSIGMVMAATGKGKSALMGDMALKMARNGYTGAYLTLELGTSELMIRFDSAISGIPLGHIPDKPNKVAKALKQAYFKPESGIYPSPLYVQYSPTKSIGISDVEQFVEDLRIQHGVTLDFLVVDYFDLLKMEGSYTDRVTALEENMEVLRGLAGKYNMVIWTASQTNRGGVNKEDVDMADIAAGYGKVFSLDMLLIVNQTPEERETGMFRLKVDKSRVSIAGAELYVRSDFSRMNFQFFTEEEAEQLNLVSARTSKASASSTAFLSD